LAAGADQGSGSVCSDFNAYQIFESSRRLGWPGTPQAIKQSYLIPPYKPMPQKPATPAPRKADAAKKPAVKAPAAKPVKKAGATPAAPSGDLDALVNKYLAAFRNAEKTLTEAKALAATYRERYPELAAYFPEGAAEERALELREDAADEAAGSHHFRIRTIGKGPRYEVRGVGEDDYRHVEAAAWLQAFKDHLAVRIAKVILAREAAEGSK
jgi:hypothetical protein